jgi:D-tyrosyl-tRNA(Tyr) deacylase
LRGLVQRVSRASVTVGQRRVGAIERGLLVLVGFRAGDTLDKADWMADRLVGLRIFSDAQDRMNLSIQDVGGSILIVSQFTLYGDASKGRRPSFVEAARPEDAIPLYERLIEAVRSKGITVETGEFGAMMQVELVNDGPVTLLMDR